MFLLSQTLKIIRYTTKLLLATALKGSDAELAARLKRFESSIGTSRCAAAAALLGRRLAWLAWAKAASPLLLCPTNRHLTIPCSKAYRLGKFLGDVNTLRKTRLHGPFAALEWVAAGGECCYYFVDQLVWWVLV